MYSYMYGMYGYDGYIGEHMSKALPQMPDEEVHYIEWRGSNSRIRDGVMKVIAVMEKWFWRIEDGTSKTCFPDIHGERFTKEYVDKVIKCIDDYVIEELTRSASYHANTGMETKGKPINRPSDFNRLEGASREAFVQDVIKTMKAVGYME